MLQIDFINTGYGDAFLLREDSGFTMLVDCGDIDTGTACPKSMRVTAAEFLLRENIEKLDILAISHLHKDHAGGIAAVCDSVAVAELWTNWICGGGDVPAIPVCKSWKDGPKNLVAGLNEYCRAVKCLAESGARFRVFDGQSETLPLSHKAGDGMYMEITGADRGLYNRQGEILAMLVRYANTGLPAENAELEAALEELDGFINNTSLRLRITYQGRSVLLPGDVSAAYWENNPPRQSDILKVPHHGHKDSASKKILDAIQPRYAVVSVSNDRPDPCPNAEILNLISAYAGETFFTDAVALPQGSAKDAAYHRTLRFKIEAEKITRDNTEDTNHV